MPFSIDGDDDLQITSEIWQVGGPGFTATEDAAVYLIVVDGHMALVDAGCGGNDTQLIANIRDCGIDPDQMDYLLLTHCHFDHTGGAGALRDRYGCVVVAHELDVPALEGGNTILTAAHWYGRSMPPLPVDVHLHGSEAQIQLGPRRITAIHTPGHTPGSVVYLMQSDGQRVLFGQDVHGPLHDDFLSDATAYRQSLNRMLDLSADILCEGHFGVYRGQARVREFIRSFL